MMALMIIISIVIGVLVGMNAPFLFSGSMSIYISVVILAIIDSLLGAARAYLESKFDSAIFLSGVLANALLATTLAFVGDNLGLPLYYAALFVFGTRLFENVSIIRRLIIEKHRLKKQDGVKSEE